MMMMMSSSPEDTTHTDASTPTHQHRAQNLEGLYLMGFEAGKVRAHPR